MHISGKGLALIKSFEGCLRPDGKGGFVTYVCPAGVLTIGWGHTNDGGRAFKAGDVWTQAECDAALASDMIRYEEMVKRRVKVSLNQNQFDALVSFTYNCGEGNLAKSTLLKKVNAKEFYAASEQFASWNKGGGQVLRGLTRRRAAEAKLFSEPVGAAPTTIPIPPKPSPDPMPQQVDPPKQDRPSFFEKIGTWITALAGSGAAAFFTDWRVVAVIVGATIAVAAAGILFMGQDNVRRWIREKVNR